MSRAARRYYRTLLLGVAALGALVWMAVRQFDISRQEMLHLLLVTLLVAGVIIVLAALATALWMTLRKLLARRAGRSQRRR